MFRLSCLTCNGNILIYGYLTVHNLVSIKIFFWRHLELFNSLVPTYIFKMLCHLQGLFGKCELFGLLVDIMSVHTKEQLIVGRPNQAYKSVAQPLSTIGAP